MREMPVLLADGTIDDCLVGIVQSHMLHPDDLASIEEDIAVTRIRAQTGFRDTHLGRQRDAYFKSAQLGGIYAGQILVELLSFAHHRPDLKVGVNKSIFALTMKGQEAGKTVERNRNTVRKFWTQYKNSAHLWAAHQHIFSISGKKYPINYVSVLTVSQRIVEFASPFIDDWSPWTVPENFPFDDTNIKIPEPDAEDVSRIKRYRV